MTDPNKYFHVEIGEAITEDEFQVAMSMGKFWCTKMMANDRTYGGLIYADNLEQAEKVAKKRGWGEEIQGCLHDVIDWNHESINPCNIKNLN